MGHSWVGAVGLETGVGSGIMVQVYGLGFSSLEQLELKMFRV